MAVVVPSRQASVVAEVRARQAVAEGGVARGRHRAGVAEVGVGVTAPWGPE